jgi:hypothetical protein
LEYSDLPAIPRSGLVTVLPLAAWQRMFHAPILPHYLKTRYRTLEGLEGLEAFLFATLVRLTFAV